MGIEDLTQLDLIDGIIGLIYPAVGILVGGIISSKYAKYKRKELLFVGLSLIFVTLPYFALGITFITVVFFDFVLSDIIFFLIFLGFTAIGAITWLWAMAILLFPEKLKTIVSINAAFCIAYEIYLFMMVFTNPAAIVTRVTPMSLIVSPIVSLFALFALLSFLITILMFIRICFRSDNLRTIWKGRFLLVSVIIFTIATIIFLLNPTDIILILTARVLYILRIFLSYFGWLLPERVAKMLIKEKE